VRRNALSDFTNVKSNGKIAMDLPEDEHSMHRVLRQRMLALANYVASGRADP